MLRLKLSTSGVPFSFNIDCAKEDFDKEKFCQLYAIEASRIASINQLNGGGFHEPDAINAAAAALKDMDATTLPCAMLEIDLDAEEARMKSLLAESARHLPGQIFVPALESWNALVSNRANRDSSNWDNIYSWCSDSCEDTAVAVGEASAVNTDAMSKAENFAKIGFRPAIRIPGPVLPKIRKYALYIASKERVVRKENSYPQVIFQTGQEIAFRPSVQPKAAITWLHAHDDIYISDRVLLSSISYYDLEEAGFISGVKIAQE